MADNYEAEAQEILDLFWGSKPCTDKAAIAHWLKERDARRALSPSPAKEPESMEAKWSEPCGSCPHDWGSHSSDGECAADRCYCLHFCPPAVEKPCGVPDHGPMLHTKDECSPAVAPVESLTDDEGEL